ncbi:MAG TPA: ABC transporter permease [Vicinamibacteria bacterium]|nr:ABC transporter permease [Vicinamibacteria bacterium]
MTEQLRLLVRGFRRRPGFALAFVGTLSTAIGVNAAMFGLVNGILLRPLPFRDPDRLYCVYSTGPDRSREPFSIPDFLDYQQRSRLAEALGASGTWGANLTGDGDPERLLGRWVTPGFFGLLGADPALGRRPLPEEERAGGRRVVLLSHGLWRRRFAADPAVLERTLRLNGESYSVIGVLAPGFVLPGREADLVVPLVLETDARRNARGADFMRMIARLGPGVTPAQFQDEFVRIAQSLRQEYAETNAAKTGVSLAGVHAEIVGSVRVLLLTLQGAMALMLAIAAVNLANLVLARVAARAQELALRAAIGAGQSELVRLVVGETVLLAVAGGALGLVVAQFALRVLLALGPAELPRRTQLGFDTSVALLAFGLALATGALAGLVPALRAARTDPQDALREHTRSGPGRANRVGRLVLVASEFGLALVLLAGAVLLIQSFLRLSSVDPGWQAPHVLTARLSLPRDRYGNPAALAAFYERLALRLRRLPGVAGAAAASVLPLEDWRATVNFATAGRPLVDGAGAPAAQYRMISEDYFRTLGIPLLKGRGFTAADGPQAAPVAIVNGGLARRFFGEASPIGSTLTIDDGGRPRSVEIVGVVGDVKHYGLDAPATFDVYVPILQIPQPVAVWLANNMSFAVSTAGEPMLLAEPLRRELRAVDPEVPAASVRSLDDALEASLAARRFALFLLNAFALFALFLAAIGTYAVTAQAVAARTREIGVRTALGASQGQVMGLLLRQSLRPVVVGLASGLVVALVAVRMASSLLYGVSPNDPVTLLTVALTLLAVAVLAIAVPGWRALSIPAMRALRSE